MPSIQPLFSKDGRVSFLILQEELSSAILVDPDPRNWGRYEKRAQRHGCTIQAVLSTRYCEQTLQDAPWARVSPVGALDGVVKVRLGNRVRDLPVGMSEAVLRVRGLLVGIVVVSLEKDGQLAFVVPDGNVIIGGGRLSVSDDAEPVPVAEMIPDWTLGILDHGTVYSTTAPDGVFRRPIDEEVQLRDLTRSRILARLAAVGGADREQVARALGM